MNLCRDIIDSLTDAIIVLSPTMEPQLVNPAAAGLRAGMSPDDGRAHQYCGVILTGGDRISSLVEQVLAVRAPGRMPQERVNIHQILPPAMRMAGLFPNPPADVTVVQD